jgi:beta-lactamase class A
VLSERARKTWLRLPPLTALLVRAVVLLFTGVTVWRLSLAGVEMYDAARFQRPAIVAQPVQPIVSTATDAGLNTILRSAGAPPGVLGAYVRNLSTGVGGGVSSDRRFPAASLYKLPVLVEVYRQQRLKAFNWDDELTIGRDDWADGSGVLQARVGDRLKIGELVQLMIVQSDNIAANMLTDLVGASRVNETMLALGLKNTRVIDRARENASPVTTPEDMGRLLEIVATGRLVDAQTSEEAIRLLETKQAQNWLADGLPWWGKLAHKWGDLPNARHDAGIIFTPHNQIVIVVMTEGAGATAAAEEIKNISRQIVAYVEGPGP